MGLRGFSAGLHLREAASASATSPVFTAHSHRALQQPARCTLSLRVGQQPASHRTSSPPSPLPLSPRARLSDEPTFTTCHHHACFSRQPRSRFTLAPQSAVPLSPHARTAPTSATGRSLTTSPHHTRQSCTRRALARHPPQPPAPLSPRGLASPAHAARSHGGRLSHPPLSRHLSSPHPPQPPALLSPRALARTRQPRSRTAPASATGSALAARSHHARRSRQSHSDHAPSIAPWPACVAITPPARRANCAAARGPGTERESSGGARTPRRELPGQQVTRAARQPLQVIPAAAPSRRRPVRRVAGRRRAR